MAKYKIFTIDYLMHNEFDEDDLYWIFDTSSLIYSLIIAMFRYIDILSSDLSNDEILKICKKDNSWIYKYTWSVTQRNKFEKQLIEVYKNIYRINEDNAKCNAQMWLLNYGFKIKNNTLDNEKNWK